MYTPKTEIQQDQSEIIRSIFRRRIGYGYTNNSRRYQRKATFKTKTCYHLLQTLNYAGFNTPGTPTSLPPAEPSATENQDADKHTRRHGMATQKCESYFSCFVNLVSPSHVFRRTLANSQWLLPNGLSVFQERRHGTTCQCFFVSWNACPELIFWGTCMIGYFVSWNCMQLFEKYRRETPFHMPLFV